MEIKIDEQLPRLSEEVPEGNSTHPKDPNQYYVDKVIDHRFNRRGLPEFHVLWRGYGRSQATWEPLPNVLGNAQFADYWETLDAETRKHIRPPGNTRIGADRDGLCVRRAVEKLRLPGVDSKKFLPWMELKDFLSTLRNEGCNVKKLRVHQRTRKKKLLCIGSTHATGINCNRGSNSVRDKYQVIYVVTKRN